MSGREQLHLYIGQVQHRLRLNAGARGAAIVAAVALGTTVVLTILLNAYAFPEGGLTPARLVLFFILGATVAFGLAWPWLRLNRRRSVYSAEAAFPALDQRLLTFTEREQSGDPFLDLLAADTLAVAGDAPPNALAPQGRLLAMLAAAILCVGVLTWMVTAAPGFLGYGARVLWEGPKHEPVPIYEIVVTPGDQAVRRNSDQMVTAEVRGLTAGKVTLFARYQSGSKFEPVNMQPQINSINSTIDSPIDGSGFQFMFAGLPESVEYYVQAGAVRSRLFKFRVVDLPSVKAIHVAYRYPKWTGMETAAEEQGGDLRALEGTDADLTVAMDSPLKDGVLALQDPDGNSTRTLHLTGGEGNVYHGTIYMDGDGAYHVAAVDQGQAVRLSEDYFISTGKAQPPQVSIDRPGQDYRATPIEEVTIGVHAGAEFGLNHLSLHYSVNGGPDQTVNLLKSPGAKDANGTATLSLEAFKLSPGDVISLYATAKDAHSESKTDISFIQAEPFEREFSQSQASGGGGGGGGGGQDQTEISRRQKELIAQTWKQVNDKRMTGEQAVDMGNVLSDAQARLRDQVLALSGRVQSRELSDSNEEFTSFDKDMQIAAEAMAPSADKLKKQAWNDAMPHEQKALQALLRAEATFRRIEVAFNSRGGGGGGQGSSGRDLASLFDLELDTEKNQYETAQTGSPQEEQAKKVDDALARLDALAKRQEEIAQKQGPDAQSFQQRWQQEMLRREAEKLQHDMEQMQQQMQKNGQQTASAGQPGQSGSSQSGQQQGQQSGNGQGKAGQSQQADGSAPGGSDPRVQQALSRLRSANDAMRRAAATPQAGQQGGQQAGQQGGQQSGQHSGQSGAGQQSQAQQQAAQAAAQRLREATNALSGAQTDQANGRLDQMANEAGRLAREEKAQADRIHTLAAKGNDGTTPTEEQRATNIQERNRLASERQQLSDDLAHLQRNMRDTARGLASNQPDAASKLRDALGGMDQSDLGNRVQRSADWLRRGINPESNGTEAGIASDLKSLSDQVGQAQRAMGQARNGGGKGKQGTQTAALDSLDRLRDQIQGMGRNGGQQGGQPGGQQGGQQAGQQGGQQRGQQAGQQAGQQGGQPGQQPGQQQGSQNGNRGGDLGNRQAGNPGGGGSNGANWDVDTGNQKYDPSRRAAAAGHAPTPADTEQTIRQGLQELNQLRALARSDPATQREIDALAKEMQNLDPARFPGNPAMVEQMHAQILNDVDKLELQLRRNNDDPQTAQVRTNKAPAVPAGYQNAVADYFKKLSQTSQPR